MDLPEVLSTRGNVPTRIKWYGDEWITLSACIWPFILVAILAFIGGVGVGITTQTRTLPTIKDMEDSAPTRIEWNDHLWVPELTK